MLKLLKKILLGIVNQVAQMHVLINYIRNILYIYITFQYKYLKANEIIVFLALYTLLHVCTRWVIMVTTK